MVTFFLGEPPEAPSPRPSLPSALQSWRAMPATVYGSMFSTQGNCARHEGGQIKGHIPPSPRDGHDSYPDLLVVFDGAAALPVEAEAHEVDAEDAGQGFDARPLHCGSLETHERVMNMRTASGRDGRAGDCCVCTFSLHFSQ